MSITKTNIYSSTAAATNATNLYNYLLENAVPEYFDSVEISEEGTTISCYVGELEFLRLSLPLNATSDSSFIVNTLSGESYSTMTPNAESYVQYVYKCKNGLSFKIRGMDNFTISIVKDNNGKTTIIFPVSCYSSGYKLNLYTDYSTKNVNNPTNRIFVVSVDSDEISYISGVMKTGNNLTGIVPLPVTDNSDKYTPNAYLIAYSQTATEGALNINGVNYLSNGQWCIKDE